MTFEITITATVKPEFEAKANEIEPSGLLYDLLYAWSEDVDELMSYNDKVFTMTSEVRLVDD